MDLPGPWVAHPADDALRRTFPDDDLDDRSWPEVAVPGHWRDHPDYAEHDGPMLYRTRFEAPAPPEGRRSWLEFDGLFYLGDVWLDGSYLGPTEGYFSTHALDVTAALGHRTGHLLAVEVACPPVTDRANQRTLTGTTQGAWNPGGIWRPVRLRETGPVPLRQVQVVCTDATPAVATLALRAVVDTVRPRPVVFHTTVLGVDHRHRQPLAAGENRIEWMVRVPHPPLWWPHDLGGQPLFDLTLTVTTEDSEVSDRALRRVGFRSVRMHEHTWRINGERLFLKGAIVPPLRRDMASITSGSATADLALARDIGLNLIRVAGHVSAPPFYDAADETGMLVWQDMPLRGGYHRGVRSQAMTQARRLVELLGHHPSVVVWCGHDAPDPVDRTRPAPRLLEQQKPNWTRTVLDRSVRRTLDRADPSRPVISHSGVLPNLPRLDDADSHLWFGWHGGHAADLESYIARLPRAGRFVSAFGAQSVPDGLDVAAPGGWPTVDWERLARELDADTDVLARRFPPGHYADADAWSAATRRHQAHVLRIQIETLRRRKYRPTGGFAIDRLLDGAPAISGSLLDHRRTPKVAYRVVAAACAETIVVASPPPLTLVPRSVLRCEVCVIHDGRRALEDVRVTADLTIAGETLTWTWEGRVEADAVTSVGLVEWPLGSARGELRLDLGLVATDATSENGYTTRIGA